MPVNEYQASFPTGIEPGVIYKAGGVSRECPFFMITFVASAWRVHLSTGIPCGANVGSLFVTLSELCSKARR